MKQTLKQGLVLSLLITTLFSNTANAFNISYSDKTKKTSVNLNFKAGLNLPFNLGINGGLDVFPSYSSIVGPMSNAGDERWGVLTSGELNLAYNLNLFDAKTIVGDFNPTLSPYIGYKHYISSTGTGGLGLSQVVPTTSFSNIGGINYGLRFTSSIPLGFFVYAEAGATSLLNGSWTQSTPENSGSIMGNSLLLPTASVGASFNLLNVLTLRAGYNLKYVPDIRTPNAPLNDSSKTLLHSLDVGLTFLFFSI